MTSTLTATTRYATSADGTKIAYEVHGSGPALVLVDGAMCHRSMGPARGLAEQLAGRFSVHAYDRRGRGSSGPGTAPYAVAVRSRTSSP
jgi:pimeloyl-ACP methyl ester carboxylesterase